MLQKFVKGRMVLACQQEDLFMVRNILVIISMAVENFMNGIVGRLDDPHRKQAWLCRITSADPRPPQFIFIGIILVDGLLLIPSDEAISSMLTLRRSYSMNRSWAFRLILSVVSVLMIPDDIRAQNYGNFFRNTSFHQFILPFITIL